MVNGNSESIAHSDAISKLAQCKRSMQYCHDQIGTNQLEPWEVKEYQKVIADFLVEIENRTNHIMAIWPNTEL